MTKKYLVFFFLNSRHLCFTCSVLLPSRKRKNSNKEKMYLMPPMQPIFHFFLIPASAKGNLKLSGPRVLKLLGRKQTKRTDLLELMETSYLRLLTYWGAGRAGGIYMCNKHCFPAKKENLPLLPCKDCGGKFKWTNIHSYPTLRLNPYRQVIGKKK